MMSHKKHMVEVLNFLKSKFIPIYLFEIKVHLVDLFIYSTHLLFHFNPIFTFLIILIINSVHLCYVSIH